VQKKKTEFSKPVYLLAQHVDDAQSVLPKTTETIELLNRGLTRYADMHNESSDDEDQTPPLAQSNSGRRRHGAIPSRKPSTSAPAGMVNVIHHRSIAWVIGYITGLETVMLGLAALIFVRRDF